MIKKTNLRLMAVAIIAVLTFSVSAFARLYDGSGTETDPFIIDTAEKMNDIGANSGDWGGYFLMTADINMAGYTYTTALIAPDTDNTSWDFDGIPFIGTFDGSGHTIHNFTIDTSDTNNSYYLGLFGQLRSGAIVSNLRLENTNITGGTYCVGGLCGSNGDWDYTGGTITNCHFTGNVTSANSSAYVGGLVGFNCWGSVQSCNTNGFISCDDHFGGLVGWNHYGTISNCYTNSHVLGRDNAHSVGGIVGYNEYGNISNCYSSGNVTGEDNSYAVGGIVGTNDEGNINNCYAVGSVDACDALGNLVGKNSYGTISNCYSAGTVIGKRYTIGGLVGYNYGGNVMNCYASDSVTGGDNSAHLGGLAGWNEGVISNCYASGSVTGGISSGRIGGLVGRNGRTITNCYAAGTVGSGSGSSNLAGLCGYQWGYYAEISNCFWDTESTGRSVGYNLDSTDPGAITNVFGKITAEMQHQSTFADYGWDFVAVWKMCSEDSYPLLAWQNCPGPEAPILDGEPEITVGANNTIFWAPVADANDYYAECAEDPDFAWVYDNSGWVADANYMFTDLEQGYVYWYRVKAKSGSGVESDWSNVESSMQISFGDAAAASLSEAAETISNLDSESLKNPNMKNTLGNKIDVVLGMLDAGMAEAALAETKSGNQRNQQNGHNSYIGAINKLENDILAKTDGCANGGEPDINDWILTCDEQDEIYQLITEAIDYLERLTE